MSVHWPNANLRLLVLRAWQRQRGSWLLFPYYGQPGERLTTARVSNHALSLRELQYTHCLGHLAYDGAVCTCCRVGHGTVERMRVGAKECSRSSAQHQCKTTRSRPPGCCDGSSWTTILTSGSFLSHAKYTLDCNEMCFKRITPSPCIVA